MLDTMTPHRDIDDFNTMAACRHDPDEFLTEARTGAREAAAHMKDLAERFAELRNAIMRLPGNPSRGDRAGLRHRLLHIEDTPDDGRARKPSLEPPAHLPVPFDENQLLLSDRLCVAVGTPVAWRPPQLR